MPAKNSVKIYVENGFYHVYNRGVNREKIFIDEVDYKVFLSYLKLYLLSREELKEELEISSPDNLLDSINKDSLIRLMRTNNYYQRIELLCYCLLPNHYHLLIRQKNKRDLEFFMRSIGTKYTNYFNTKYQRVGSLFQGVYRAVYVKNEVQLLHLSRYIHLNPQELIKNNSDLLSYPWSSYPVYIKNWNVKWLNKSYILSFFKKTEGVKFGSYQGFVEGYIENDWFEKEDNKALLID